MYKKMAHYSCFCYNVRLWTLFNLKINPSAEQIISEGVFVVLFIHIAKGLSFFDCFVHGNISAAYIQNKAGYFLADFIHYSIASFMYLQVNLNLVLHF